MVSKEVIVTILARGGTTADWAEVNPTPKNREFCVEETTDGKRKFKIGDGVTAWSDLPYATSDELADLAQDATHRTVTDAEKAAWNAKQDALTFDEAPTAGSANPVKSGGVKTALDAKANNADLATIAKSGKLSDATEDATHRVVTDTEKATWNAKQDALTFDTTPTANSSNPVTSGGVKTALDAKAAKSEIVKTSTGLTDSADLMRYTDTLTISGGGVS